MKLIRGRKSIFLLTLLLCMVLGCIEEIEIDTSIQENIDIEQVLVVEATITDELKEQEILLSRGSSFANDSIVVFERNAQVSVTDDAGAVFNFQDQGGGRYVSAQPFAARNGVSYTLSITTEKGEEFVSDQVQSSGVSVMDDLYARRIVNDEGEEGMAIYVDSSNPNGDFNNYRYTYEETYKIIAPNWTAFEFEVIRYQTEFIFDVNGEVVETLYPDIRLVPRAQEERVCFNSESSNDIILSDGVALNSAEIDRNLVRFIDRDNAIISHRYSILVKQFLQSPDAANFYKTLLQFSQNENLFSAIQPGTIEGNISPNGDSEGFVIGYFEVASVAQRRLFFNYGDFFPEEPLPPYFGTVNCDRLIAPLLGNPLRDGPIPPMAACGEGLIALIEQERVEFSNFNGDPPGECEGPYFVTQRACGDCTALGSNIVPEFWTE